MECRLPRSDVSLSARSKDPEGSKKEGLPRKVLSSPPGPFRLEGLPFSDLFRYFALLAFGCRGFPAASKFFEFGFHKSRSPRFAFRLVASHVSHVQNAPLFPNTADPVCFEWACVLALLYSLVPPRVAQEFRRVDPMETAPALFFASNKHHGAPRKPPPARIGAPSSKLKRDNCPVIRSCPGFPRPDAPRCVRSHMSYPTASLPTGR
jgi:hypothetical protein